MFFVPCPRCGAAVDVSADADGLDRRVPWNVVSCDECDFAFDYDDAEVQTTSETPATG